MNELHAVVAGAGLAGAEAAWQLAERGILVELYEMKPERHSPAHHTENFAELVCSNSFRSDQCGRPSEGGNAEAKFPNHVLGRQDTCPCRRRAGCGQRRFFCRNYGHDYETSEH